MIRYRVHTPLQPFREGAHIVRRRAATAAEHAHARLRHGGENIRKRTRVHVVVSVHRVGQARVGLGDHGQVGILAQLPQQRREPVRPQRAVEPDGVRAMDATVQPVNVRPVSSKDMVTSTGRSVFSLTASSAAFVS